MKTTAFWTTNSWFILRYPLLEKRQLSSLTSKRWGHCLSIKITRKRRSFWSRNRKTASTFTWQPTKRLRSLTLMSWTKLFRHTLLEELPLLKSTLTILTLSSSIDTVWKLWLYRQSTLLLRRLSLPVNCFWSSYSKVWFQKAPEIKETFSEITWDSLRKAWLITIMDLIVTRCFIPLSKATVLNFLRSTWSRKILSISSTIKVWVLWLLHLNFLRCNMWTL